jgi:hypothetical protein
MIELLRLLLLLLQPTPWLAVTAKALLTTLAPILRSKSGYILLRGAESLEAKAAHHDIQKTHAAALNAAAAAMFPPHMAPAAVHASMLLQSFVPTPAHLLAATTAAVHKTCNAPQTLLCCHTLQRGGQTLNGLMFHLLLLVLLLVAGTS